jgi:hypothetical protein
LLTLALCQSLGMFSQKQTYTTTKWEGPNPKIDGHFSEPSWNNLPWSDSFTQTLPREKQAPSQKTAFKIFYDDTHLYVAIKCFDSQPDSIDRRLARRDDFDGDWVGIFIDSYHDQRTDFTFTVNAAGVKSDGNHSNDGNQFDDNWDPIWEVKTSIDAEGWTAEMAIPLTQLRFADKKEHIWGLQVMRYLYRKGEESLWQFKSPKAPGWVSHYGELHGINNIVPRKQKDLTPYALGKYNTYKKEAGNPFAPGREWIGSMGMDGKIGITNDLTLDFTINPDFGQVEADPSEVNLSTFETYLEEKRPFFIEGKSIMNFTVTPGDGGLSRDNAFYTRRLGKKPGHCPETIDGEYLKMPKNTTILGAFKVTGKTQKGWSIGVMESVTQKELALIDNNEERREVVVEPLSNYFVGRVQKDLNQGNTRFGGIFTATHRNLNDEGSIDLFYKNAYVGGIDFNHQWKDKTYYFNFSALASQVNASETALLECQSNAPHFFQRPGASHLGIDSTATSLAGFGGSLNVGRAGNGKWMYTLWLTWRSPALQFNDLGYMRTTDIIEHVAWAGFRQNEAIGIFRFIGLNFNQWSGHTFEGERTYLGANFNGHCEFINFWSMGTGISTNGRSVNTQYLRGGPAYHFSPSIDAFYYMATNSKKKVQMHASYSLYSRDKYDDHTHRYSMSVNFRLMESVQFSLHPFYMVRTDNQAWVNHHEEAGQYILGKMDQKETSLIFRLNIYLTPDFSIQYYGMPFISVGKYSNFKYVTDPAAAKKDDRFVLFSSEQIALNDTEDDYIVWANGPGQTGYTFENPNFNSCDFNSNLVLRWEYKPGSLLYVVWSQNRNNWQDSMLKSKLKIHF